MTVPIRLSARCCDFRRHKFWIPSVRSSIEKKKDVNAKSFRGRVQGHGGLTPLPTQSTFGGTAVSVKQVPALLITTQTDRQIVTIKGSV
jgi:hypothetical protein